MNENTMNAFLIQNITSGETAIILVDSDGIIVAAALNDGCGTYHPDRVLDAPALVDLSEWRVLR